MIVLDTNVLSEFAKPKPDSTVLRRIDALDRNLLFTTAICEAELRFGLESMPDGRRKDELTGIVEALFREQFEGRVLAFDSRSAAHFAKIMANRQQLGRLISLGDAQIAAIASANRALLTTRNARDFAETGVPVWNPWAADFPDLPGANPRE